MRSLNPHLRFIPPKARAWEAYKLKLTGENVTECLGGARSLTDADLTRAYKSTVDPRLNYEQSLELAMIIVRKEKEVESLSKISRPSLSSATDSRQLCDC